MTRAPTRLVDAEDRRERPLMSVIIPAYNSKSFIQRALASLAASTTPLEVIVVENGSKELVDADLRDALGGHELLLATLDQADLSSARNHGLQLATGEWVLFLDSDDWVDIDLYVQLAQRNDSSRCDLIAAGVAREAMAVATAAPSGGHTVEKDAAIRFESGPLQLLRSLLLNHYSPVTGAYLFRRTRIQQVGLWFDAGFIHEDHAFTASARLSAKSVISTKLVGLHKLDRPGSLTRTASPEQSMRGYARAKERLQTLETRHRAGDAVPSTAKILLIQRLQWILDARRLRSSRRFAPRLLGRWLVSLLSYVAIHAGVGLWFASLQSYRKIDPRFPDGQRLHVLPK